MRASRIAAVGTGGQLLLSDATRSIVDGGLGEGVSLRALGERRLKDIDRPEPLFELVIDGLEPAEATTPPPTHENPPPAAERTAPMRDFVDRTRQTIESRVLAQLERSLGSGFPFEGAEPPQPPKRAGSLTREIGRLRALHEDGALSDEQYRRAVDRLLDDDGSPGA